MKTVVLTCIACLWAICMVYGTRDVWANGMGEVALMWFMVTFLCSFAAGVVLVMFDFLTKLLNHFQH